MTLLWLMSVALAQEPAPMLAPGAGPEQAPLDVDLSQSLWLRRYGHAVEDDWTLLSEQSLYHRLEQVHLTEPGLLFHVQKRGILPDYADAPEVTARVTAEVLFHQGDYSTLADLLVSPTAADFSSSDKQVMVDGIHDAWASDGWQVSELERLQQLSDPRLLDEARDWSIQAGLSVEEDPSRRFIEAYRLLERFPGLSPVSPAQQNQLLGIIHCPECQGSDTGSTPVLGPDYVAVFQSALAATTLPDQCRNREVISTLLQCGEDPPDACCAPLLTDLYNTRDDVGIGTHEVRTKAAGLENPQTPEQALSKLEVRLTAPASTPRSLSGRLAQSDYTCLKRDDRALHPQIEITGRSGYKREFRVWFVCGDMTRGEPVAPNETAVAYSDVEFEYTPSDGIFWNSSCVLTSRQRTIVTQSLLLESIERISALFGTKLPIEEQLQTILKLDTGSWTPLPETQNTVREDRLCQTIRTWANDAVSAP